MSSEDSTIRDRVVAFIVHITKASTSRYKEMEKETGITSEKWQNVAAKKQRVTEEMLEAIGRQWPEYSYWLMTGQTDYKHNHLDPDYEEWMNRHMRYSQSDQIILVRPPFGEALTTAPITHKIRVNKDLAGEIDFDWGALNQGSIELAANILLYCGLNEVASISLAKAFAREILATAPVHATMIAEEEVRDWIKKNM